MITGIEATRPQCGKKAWRKSENVRSAERAYTDCPKSVKKRKKRKRYTEEKKYDKVKKKR